MKTKKALSQKPSIDSLNTSGYWHYLVQDHGLPKDCLIAVGGNGFIGSDIDLIYIADKIKPDRLAKFREEVEADAGKKVSICPMTKIMYEHHYLWSGKVARMFYKGVTWLYGEGNAYLSFRELKNITRRNAPEELSQLIKVAVTTPEKKDNAMELIIQLASLLVEY